MEDILSHLEHLRQDALLKRTPYSYADLSQQLGINPEQVEDPALYQRGIEMLEAGYEGEPEPSPLEKKAGRAKKPITQRDLEFLEKAKPYRNNPEGCNILTLVDLIKEYYPNRFTMGGKQPLVLYGEKTGNHEFKRYERMQIIKIFTNVYNFYSGKAREAGY